MLLYTKTKVEAAANSGLDEDEDKQRPKPALIRTVDARIREENFSLVVYIFFFGHIDFLFLFFIHYIFYREVLKTAIMNGEARWW